MLRAVLDANVIISAAIRPAGPPGRIVNALLAREAFELILSPAIAAEAERALRQARVRKYLRSPRDAPLWLADIVALADLVGDTGRAAGACRDPADDKVLSAALEGRAHAIITGDEDLLILKNYEGIAILEPRTFLDSLKP